MDANREVKTVRDMYEMYPETRPPQFLQEPVPFYSLENAGRRFFTREGIQEAIDDSYVQPYRQFMYNMKNPGGYTKTVRDTYRGARRVAEEGIKVPFTSKVIPGSKFAGQAVKEELMRQGTSGKTLRAMVNVIPGLSLLGDVFDVAEAVVGVARRDGVRQGQAKELAKEMAAQGLSLDDAMKYIESTPELQDLAGNIGADDFAKTAAYAAWTGGPSLNPIAAAAGAITAGDLQREKAIRNRMFKDEFMKASANAQQGMGF